jgi:hypothetical protein
MSNSHAARMTAVPFPLRKRRFSSGDPVETAYVIGLSAQYAILGAHAILTVGQGLQDMPPVAVLTIPRVRTTEAGCELDLATG